MGLICPAGHASSDADYCSECGVPMRAGPAAPATVPVTASALAPGSAAAGGEPCPDCGTPRGPGAKFCEICRYNFETHTSFGVLETPAPIAAPPADPAPPPSAPAPAISAPAASLADPAPAADASADDGPLLRLRIVVDPALDTDPDPAHPCPQGTPERIFHLDLAENTLGRQYDGKGICPEIVVPDPGISRRHLKIYREGEDWAVLDLGSSNGTSVNGSDLEAGVVRRIATGDQITLGMWTRIFVEARPPLEEHKA